MRDGRIRCRGTASALSPVLFLLLSLQAWPGLAADTPTQSEPKPNPGTTRDVAPGAHYQAGPLHRLLLGAGYRDLWRSVITVEVLDLDSFSGGIRPRKKGGGKQTLSLTFEDKDGREWKFRSIDKDPSAVLPGELRDTFVDALVQDQVSSAHPLGPMVVDPLAAAAGILGAAHRLVLLPDDDRLGAFRAEFGGKLGFIEEKIRSEPPVTPGFDDFHKLLNTVDLWNRLDEHPEEKVDAAALLRVRLFDLFINDFDRHKDQWQWARRKGTDLWQPVPEDRDQAFVRYSGLILSLVRPSQPRLVDFGPKYPSIFGLTWQGRFVDRRHLAELEWPQWQEAIKALQASITESTIDDAVGRLPPEYRKITSARTAQALKSRLRRLPEAARKFYEQLATDVEIHGSDKDETVNVTRVGERIQVEVTGKQGQVRFKRRFDPGETHAIRIYLKGGDDSMVRGEGTTAITIRAVGGKGEDSLDDSRAGWTRFYDEGAKTRIEPGQGTKLDTRPYEPPLDAAGNPERDWGGQKRFLPWLSAGGDLGLFVGGSVAFTGYSFRHHPYTRRQSVGAGYSTRLRAFRAAYHGDFIRSRGGRFRLDATASGLDLIRFYGIGNETRGGPFENFYQVLQDQFSISPRFEFGLGPTRVSLGALARYTQEPDRLSFAAATRPYGFGGFGKVGPRLDLEVGRRDLAPQGSGGGRLQLGASYYPKAWSVKEAFGEVHGEAAFYLRAKAPLRPTLVTRLEGKQVFGRYPFQDAAFLGGAESLRGLRPQRYAGDSMAFGSTELRLSLGRVRLLLPSDVGVFGLVDAGRVFVEGESSDLWHHSVGGGIWVAVLKPENTVSLAFARSEGVTRVYLKAGFGF